MIKANKNLNKIAVLHYSLLAFAMPLLIMICLIVASGLNQYLDHKDYTNSYNATFYREASEMLVGYVLAFAAAILIFKNSFLKVGQLGLGLGIIWLAANLILWRHAATGFKSLDCDGYGHSAGCTYLIPDHLDNTLTSIVTVAVILLSILSYIWLYRNKTRNTNLI